MNKLISMTDFVLKQNYNGKYLKNDLQSIVNYANFLKLPLQLGFFMPCDEEGNVLEHPKEVDCVMALNKCENSINKIEQYQQAKERVIFEGFEFYSQKVFNNVFLKLNGSVPFEVNLQGGIIEDLIIYNLTITENAIKKYNL